MNPLVLEQVSLILIIGIQLHQVLTVIALVVLPILILVHALIELDIMSLLLVGLFVVPVTVVSLALPVGVFIHIVIVVIVIALEEVLLLIVGQRVDIDIVEFVIVVVANHVPGVGLLLGAFVAVFVIVGLLLTSQQFTIQIGI